MSHVKLIRPFIAMLTVPLLCIGCKKMDPNPELKDPIYKDLSEIHKESEKQLKELLKTQEDNKKELEAAGANNGMDLKVARKKIRDTAKKITMTTQLVEYSRIRMERRLVEGRRSYRLAFEKGEDWPVPEEYQHYLANKRLLNSPKNWSARTKGSVSSSKEPAAPPVIEE